VNTRSLRFSYYGMVMPGSWAGALLIFWRVGLPRTRAISVLGPSKNTRARTAAPSGHTCFHSILFKTRPTGSRLKSKRPIRLKANGHFIRVIQEGAGVLYVFRRAERWLLRSSSGFLYPAEKKGAAFEK